MSNVIPWAYGKLEAYQTCPRAFYARYIAKTTPTPRTEPIIWGEQVHKALELRVAQDRALPDNMKQWERFASQLANAPGDKYCELKIGITINLEAEDFWASEKLWNRGVEDIVIVNGHKALVGDYKTGKKKPKSKQLAAAAMRIFAKFPQVEEVTSCFFWLQGADPCTAAGQTRAIYTRESIQPEIEYFFDEVEQMIWSEENNAWPAKPNGLCKSWCDEFTCPHNGRRK